MIPLPQVTLIIVDCVTYGDAVNAIQQSLKQIDPARVIMFTDIDLNIPKIEIIKIPRINSKKEYSAWMMKELGKQDIQTSHVLVCQADGFVLNGDCWNDEWLQYDYIGAPWLETDSFNVGNGGFSLRSMRLHRTLSEDSHIKPLHPEDNAICRVYRDYLEFNYGLKWAPDDVADIFSFELRQPAQPTFGFHAGFHKPYKEPIVFRRKGGMGDVISLAPVLEHFHKLGHQIVLDSDYHLVFGRHFFPVINYKHFDHQRIKHRLVNLDMSYEVNPRQLHLKSYFETCGATDYKLERPQLRYDYQDETRMFKDKYIVLHIDERETTHRNILGVDWYAVTAHLEKLGYLVVQIGHNSRYKAGIQFNTVNEPFLAWVISGCSYFIGIDSGPSHIAVALNKKCILTFGSVRAEYIHPEMTGIIALQSPCPIKEDGCWHMQPGTEGRLCPVDSYRPPCTILSTELILDAIKEMGI